MIVLHTSHFYFLFKTQYVVHSPNLDEVSFSETERQNPQTAISDKPTGIHRSKRPRVVCCRLREFSNRTWLDKNKTGSEPSE